MPNNRVATLIAEHMMTGFPYPGNPLLKTPPTLIQCFRTTGLPPELAEQIKNTSTLVGQAVVNLIETEANSVIIDRAELDKLRVADQQPGAPLTVSCRICGHPMLWLSVTNGRALIEPRMLATVNVECPHTISQNGAENG